MSLVGNFTSNGDREAVHGGTPTAVPHAQSSAIGGERVPAESIDASTIAAADTPTRTRSQTNTSSERRPTAGSNGDAISRTPEKSEKFDKISDGDDDSDYARREEEVHQLARKFTQQSGYGVTGQNPFEADPNSTLDPNGDNFNARAWCKAMLNLRTSDDKAAPIRTAGVAFRDLNVYGFGSATDFQKSVGNVWMEGLGIARRLMGVGQRRIDILQNLEGLVESGEMLVVLGPPGSGCSTFLKTITGETHGFFVDQNSKINYQGALIFSFWLAPRPFLTYICRY
jgi:ATP-binding cassette, subfamily G (WHITE), member 2, PDR